MKNSGFLPWLASGNELLKLAKGPKDSPHQSQARTFVAELLAVLRVELAVKVVEGTPITAPPLGGILAAILVGLPPDPPLPGNWPPYSRHDLSAVPAKESAYLSPGTGPIPVFVKTRARNTSRGADLREDRWIHGRWFLAAILDCRPIDLSLERRVALTVHWRGEDDYVQTVADSALRLRQAFEEKVVRPLLAKGLLPASVPLNLVVNVEDQRGSDRTPLPKAR